MLTTDRIDYQPTTTLSLPMNSREEDTEQKWAHQNMRGLVTTSSKKRPLSSSFIPGPFDVICARGSQARDHTGNRRFSLVIDMNLERYRQVSGKFAKSIIVSEILTSIRSASPEGGFVKFQGGQWYEVGDHLAREKIGQCLRDRLATLYRSSSKAKFQRRKKRLAMSDGDHKNIEVTQPNDWTKLKRSPSIEKTSSSRTAYKPSGNVMSALLQPKMNYQQQQQKVELNVRRKHDERIKISDMKKIDYKAKVEEAIKIASEPINSMSSCYCPSSKMEDNYKQHKPSALDNWIDSEIVRLENVVGV